VPGAQGIWAPDISFFEGRYHLYYSVSTFGKNRSVIGLTTNRTLDPASPDYRWVDEGKVVGSTPEDDWNAIDPNLACDETGRPGSSGAASGAGSRCADRCAHGQALRGRPDAVLAGQPAPLDPPSVEAPFIVKKGHHFYLFVSFDMCCRGKDSTYKTMVGRAKRITAPI
jgi:arabinan endo-1,5-alpha-L-arabinosidase